MSASPQAGADLVAPDRAWFARDALEVAPALLGAHLRVTSPQGAVVVRLTEVEAYRGGDDPGSHAFRGPTPRTAGMFGQAGHLYVYLSYGIHHALNLVTGPDGLAQAVLVRAGQVVDGVGLARERRLTSRREADLASGPGRLARALGLDLGDDGADLLAPGPRVSLLVARRPPAAVAGPRTGVAGQGGDGARFPWRFAVPGEASVSRHRPGRGAPGRSPVRESR